MTQSFKFGKDPGFWYRDLCKIMLNMHARGKNAHGHFWFVFMYMCTDLYQKFNDGTGCLKKKWGDVLHLISRLPERLERKLCIFFHSPLLADYKNDLNLLPRSFLGPDI